MEAREPLNHSDRSMERVSWALDVGGCVNTYIDFNH